MTPTSPPAADPSAAPSGLDATMIVRAAPRPPASRAETLATELAATARASLAAAGPAGETAWALRWLLDTDAETDADPAALAVLAAVAEGVTPGALTPGEASRAILLVEDAAHTLAADAARLLAGVNDRRALDAENVAVAEGDHPPHIRLAALLLLGPDGPGGDGPDTDDPDNGGGHPKAPPADGLAADAEQDVAGLLSRARAIAARYAGASRDRVFLGYVDALQAEAMERAADGDVAGTSAARFLLDTLNTL
ncbi:MAG: hypothetical protein CL433_13190 [Acidimicrobiaceae bacterium]|nr:hypothetical protein [Acidimicrobiaceae bacterium]